MSRVVGLERFAVHCAAFHEQFALIGGTACTLAMAAQGGADFRATKDLDIVLFIDRLSDDFMQCLRDFIRQAGYQRHPTAAKSQQFYRFSQPTQPDYPAMLEFFARPDQRLTLFGQQSTAPVLAPPSTYSSEEDNDHQSLSAIILDSAYEQWITAGITRNSERGAIPYVRAEHLIPLKARAFLDQQQRKAAGEAIDQRHLSKHRNDCLRLASVIDPDYPITLPAAVQQHMAQFLTILAQTTSQPQQWGIPASHEDLLRRLYQAYGGGSSRS